MTAPLVPPDPDGLARVLALQDQRDAVEGRLATRRRAWNRIRFVYVGAASVHVASVLWQMARGTAAAASLLALVAAVVLWVLFALPFELVHRRRVAELEDELRRLPR